MDSRVRGNDGLRERTPSKGYLSVHGITSLRHSKTQDEALCYPSQVARHSGRSAAKSRNPYTREPSGKQTDRATSGMMSLSLKLIKSVTLQLGDKVGKENGHVIAPEAVGMHVPLPFNPLEFRVEACA